MNTKIETTASKVSGLADLLLSDEQAQEIKGGAFNSTNFDSSGHGTHVAGTIGAH